MLFLQLQGFLMQKRIPNSAHRLMRKAILEAIGHDRRLLSSDTCPLYPASHICAYAQTSQTPTQLDCPIHNTLNALIHGLNNNIFRLGIRDETILRGPETHTPGAVEALVAVYTGNETRLCKVFGQVEPDEMRAAIVFPVVKCLFVAVRANRPSMIVTLMTELHKVPAANFQLRRYNERPDPVDNCFKEAIRLNRFEVFDALLEHVSKLRQSENFIGDICQVILRQARHLPRFRRDAFFRALLTRTTNWSTMDNVASILKSIGESHNESAMKILLRALRTGHENGYSNAEERANSPFADQGPRHLFTFVNTGHVRMVSLFLENTSVLFPKLQLQHYKAIREGILVEQLSSTSSDPSLVKLIVEHSEDLLEEKKVLMSLLLRPEVQAQRPERWAWLALKLGLDTLYERFPSAHPFGAVLLHYAITTLNEENVKFLISEGARLAEDAVAPLIHEDDEEALNKVTEISRLLGLVGQRHVTQRKAVTLTFNCTEQPANSQQENFEGTLAKILNTG